MKMLAIALNVLKGIMAFNQEVASGELKPSLVEKISLLHQARSQRDNSNLNAIIDLKLSHDTSQMRFDSTFAQKQSLCDRTITLTLHQKLQYLHLAIT